MITLSNYIHCLYIADFMEKLLDDSQRQFHDIFKKTYGVLYEKNSHVFREYFSQLRQYFYDGKVDLDLATKKFYSNLYQKMFQVRFCIIFDLSVMSWRDFEFSARF